MLRASKWGPHRRSLPSPEKSFTIHGWEVCYIRSVLSGKSRLEFLVLERGLKKGQNDEYLHLIIARPPDDSAPEM